MKNYKKILSLLLTTIFIFGMIGCSSNDDKKTDVIINKEYKSVSYLFSDHKAKKEKITYYYSEDGIIHQAKYTQEYDASYSKEETGENAEEYYESHKFNEDNHMFMEKTTDKSVQMIGGLCVSSTELKDNKFTNTLIVDFDEIVKNYKNGKYSDDTFKSITERFL